MADNIADHHASTPDDREKLAIAFYLDQLGMDASDLKATDPRRLEREFDARESRSYRLDDYLGVNHYIYFSNRTTLQVHKTNQRLDTLNKKLKKLSRKALINESEKSSSDATLNVVPSRMFADEETRVMNALENPEHVWRTIAGIEAEAKVDQKTIFAVFWKRRSQIIRSSRLSTTKDELFSTRQHYLDHAGFFQRLLGALRGKIN